MEGVQPKRLPKLFHTTPLLQVPIRRTAKILLELLFCLGTQDRLLEARYGCLSKTAVSGDTSLVDSSLPVEGFGKLDVSLTYESDVNSEQIS